MEILHLKRSSVNYYYRQLINVKNSARIYKRKLKICPRYFVWIHRICHLWYEISIRASKHDSLR